VCRVSKGKFEAVEYTRRTFGATLCIDSAFYLAHLSRGYTFKVTQPTHVAQTPWHPSVTLWCDICGGQSGGKYVTTLLPLTWLFYVAVVIQGENNSNGVGKVNLMF